MNLVVGEAQHYAWGDPEAIPRLLGEPATGQPFAELWFGTHPAAPSRLESGESLADYGGSLAFLVKLLAARHSLSIQVHPSADDAVSGYRSENALGITLESPQRIYRDPYAKPEMLCALTHFEALCGIAPTEEIVVLLKRLGPAAAGLLDIVAGQGGVRSAIEYLLRQRPAIDDLIAAADPHLDPRFGWMLRLSQQHPGDPAAAMALLLNHVALNPGQAIFLGPGNLHAYLHGFGLEILASSDNVVRCGLTSKHVDVDEVLRVADLTPLHDVLVPLTLDDEGGWNYLAPTREFQVTRYEVRGSRSWMAMATELVICTEGDVGELHRGRCAVAVKGQEINLFGDGTVFRIRDGYRRR